ncbi:hypothetical protein QBC45DRAFT_242375 [Copromyces sp. CBS 386.78]|nr:hypothetical protein QBC45DRAFT_242375 [Copromyces sp. CBS 386.78]
MLSTLSRGPQFATVHAPQVASPSSSNCVHLIDGCLPLLFLSSCCFILIFVSFCILPLHAPYSSGSRARMPEPKTAGFDKGSRGDGRFHSIWIHESPICPLTAMRNASRPQTPRAGQGQK